MIRAISLSSWGLFAIETVGMRQLRVHGYDIYGNVTAEYIKCEETVYRPIQYRDGDVSYNPWKYIKTLKPQKD